MKLFVVVTGSGEVVRFCYPMSKAYPNNCCLQQQSICTVFKSETTLKSHLVRPKDAVELTKQDGVVYRIPCECGKVYISETGRPMQAQAPQAQCDHGRQKYKDLCENPDKKLKKIII